MSETGCEQLVLEGGQITGGHRVVDICLYRYKMGLDVRKRPGERQESARDRILGDRRPTLVGIRRAIVRAVVSEKRLCVRHTHVIERVDTRRPRAGLGPASQRGRESSEVRAADAGHRKRARRWPVSD